MFATTAKRVDGGKDGLVIGRLGGWRKDRHEEGRLGRWSKNRHVEGRLGGRRKASSIVTGART